MEIDYNILVRAAEDAGLSDEALSPRYSGRGMFGAECVGIVYDSANELADFIIGLRDQGVNTSAMGTPSADSMGHSSIAYWRRVTAMNIPEGVF